MKEIIKDIYLIEVPLPGSPLKVLNSYFIKGKERHLLVDVGFNTDEGEAVLRTAFASLDVRLSDIDLFLTHLHSDHTGLTERLKHTCGKILIGARDGGIINESLEDAYWIRDMELQAHMGLPEGETLHYKDHPGYRGGTRTPTAFTFVGDGTVLGVGDYQFEVVDLSGHTPGQKGLYDSQKGILFCGDHILNKITPNITSWDAESDYLGLFLDHLKKVKEMPVYHLFTGHRAPVADYRERIDGIIAHHENRLNRILAILAEGPRTIYQVALGIPWDFSTSYYGDFPAEQKWFAGNEVFAHLEYLRRRGKIQQKVLGETYYYSLP